MLNVMADDASCHWDLDDPQLLAYFNSNYPHEAPWQLCALCPGMISSTMQALLMQCCNPVSSRVGGNDKCRLLTAPAHILDQVTFTLLTFSIQKKAVCGEVIGQGITGTIFHAQPLPLFATANTLCSGPKPLGTYTFCYHITSPSRWHCSRSHHWGQAPPNPPMSHRHSTS
jgi:hypothetical protein